MARGTKPKSRLARYEAIWGLLFITPWLIGFLVFVAGPMLFSLYTSFTNYDITSTFDWVGLHNYTKLLFDDKLFWISLGNTVYYAVFAVPIGIAVGVGSAVLLNMDIPGQKLFRTTFYLPRLLTGVSVLLLWMWIFNPQVGPINVALRAIGVHNPPLWFGDSAWTKPALIIMSAWGSTGGMLVYLAGLQGIPRHLYEAAEIDGATPWRQFWKITLPLLSPTIFFKLVTGISGAMQYWSSALIVADGQGGPSYSTLFYGLRIYKVAFTEMRMGYAAAMAWILLVITLIFTAVQFWVSNKWVYYEGDRR
ncbi:MAG: carbohydrate ABC transporter permease [Mycobacterium leprae]